MAISFSLSAPATVVFHVDEIAPRCRFRGTFLVRGHSGRNLMRFRGRLRGQALPPGIYRLTAYPLGRPGRRLKAVTIAIRSRMGGGVAVSAQVQNTCGASRDWAAGALGGTFPSLSGVAGARARLTSSADDASRRARISGALGSVGAAVVAVPPGLFALAALAVLLLIVAAMPQPIRTSRVGATIVHHRGTITLAGIGVLIASLISFLLL